MESQVKFRPESDASWVNRRGRRRAPENENDAILTLVREGVRRFILNDAPIGDFQKAIRVAARKGRGSTHPLTGPVFRRIVKAAMRERKRSIGRAKV